MRPNEYQHLASRTSSEVGENELRRLEHSIIGILSEAGEIADTLKRHMFYKHELNRNNLLEEYGDLLWYVAEGLTALDADMEQVMELNIIKLRLRYPDKFNKSGTMRPNYEAEQELIREFGLTKYMKSPGEF